MTWSASTGGDWPAGLALLLAIGSPSALSSASATSWFGARTAMAAPSGGGGARHARESFDLAPVAHEPHHRLFGWTPLQLVQAGDRCRVGGAGADAIEGVGWEGDDGACTKPRGRAREVRRVRRPARRHVWICTTRSSPAMSL